MAEPLYRVIKERSAYPRTERKTIRYSKNNVAAYYEPSYLLEIHLGEAVHMIALPPMLEKIFPDETYYPCLFESAATKYSTMPFNRCLYPVDPRGAPARSGAVWQVIIR